MYMSPYLDIDWLRDNCQLIHYFGLGFIQVKIDAYTRVHFYTSELPAICSEEDIHNHRYSFQSEIMHGDLYQEFFKVIDGDTHLLEKESCKADVESSEPATTCAIEFLAATRISEGGVYYLDHETFHRVKSDDCITLITRTDYKKDLADVVRPVGAVKVCPFSQKVEEVRLWEIADSMLNV